MSSTTFKNSLVKLLFQNAALAALGDAAGLQPSAAAGNIYIRLCTNAVVVDADTPGTEYSFAAGGRVPVERSAAGFDVAADVASNASDLLFGAMTANETIQYAEAWLDDSHDTEPYRIGWCELTTPIAGTVGTEPKIVAGALKLKAL